MIQYNNNPNYPDNWDDIRKAILERDKYLCCNDPSHEMKPLHVHHVVPISAGGTHELSNLITLCEDCHRKIHPFMDNITPEESDVEHIEFDIGDLEICVDFNIRDDHLKNLSDRIYEAPIEIKEALKDYQFQADEYQNDVIQADDNTIRVLAPAGSGKTQTMINRVLVNIQKGMNPNRILLLTFDNSAVNSIKDKLQNKLEKDQINIDPPEIKTLNSYGFGLLRDCFPEEFKNIVRPFVQRKILREIKEILKNKYKDIFDALPSNIQNSYYLDFFSLLKNNIFDPRNVDSQEFANFMLQNEGAEPFFSSPENKQLVKKIIQGVLWLYIAYEKALFRDGHIDFDDQKLRPFVCLLGNSTIREITQGKYSEIIVDEFQDINKLDFELIKLIANQARLVVTGDDDQAIYGFRGCSPEYILKLDRVLGRAITTYKLRKNYRSPKNIVYHSTKLIRHNTWREEKDPIPAISGSAKIKVISTGTASLEAKAIIAYIQKIRKKNKNLAFNQFAVLYRTNAQSLPLQIDFILNDIPYFVRDQDNILTNEVLEKLLGFLRLKIALDNEINPDPDDAVLAIKSYFQYVNNYQAEELLELFKGYPEFRKTIATENFNKILEKARNSNLIPAMKKALDASNLMETLEAISSFNGLRGMIGSLEDVLSERVPLGEVFDMAISFRGDIDDFVETIQSAIHKAKELNAGKDKEGGVSLLTYFRSKGLQWHTVILTTCNDGLIPHSKAPIEDERRLFYVAMTRAESNLLISFVKNSCGNVVNPSRFIIEAGL